MQIECTLCHGKKYDTSPYQDGWCTRCKGSGFEPNGTEETALPTECELCGQNPHTPECPSTMVLKPIPSPDKILEEWTAVEEDLPEYYKPVFVLYHDGIDFNEIPVLVWRASDGETDSYTIYGTAIILDGIVTFWTYANNLPSPPLKG